MICSSVPAEIERTKTRVRQCAVEARNIDAALSGVSKAQCGSDETVTRRAHFFERSDDAARVPVAALFLDQKREMQAAA